MKLLNDSAMRTEDAENIALRSKRFSVCRLHLEVNNRPQLHTHQVCEIYYSISGGRQFRVGDLCYDIEPGDVFLAAPGEDHCVTQWEGQHYERFVAYASADFLKAVSTEVTDLRPTFLNHEPGFCHKLSLVSAQQSRLEFLLRKIVSSEGYGSDLVESAAFMETLALLGGLYTQQEETRKATQDTASSETVYQGNSPLAHRLLHYIDARITEPLTISQIATAFYISDSYACRVFKEEYDITINKYIQNRRLNIAKSLLTQGVSVTETCERAGFNDYTNFIKLFTRTVGISPKQYSLYGS